MASQALAGSRILVVEDEYYLADDARAIFSGVGAEVVGPVPTVDEAKPGSTPTGGSTAFCWT